MQLSFILMSLWLGKNFFQSGTVEEDPDSIIPSQSARSHLITILDQIVDLIDVNQLQRTREICNVS